MNADFTCRICGSNNCNKYLVKEMQFGLRDEFDYYECLDCGCLQIGKYPNDMSRYYPSQYFSFSSPREKNAIKEYLNAYRDKASLGAKSFIGSLLLRKLDEPTYIRRLKIVNAKPDDIIMDVGCGSGKLLYRMGNAGFTNLLGIDPFVEKDIYYKNGVKILKKSLDEIKDKFDLITLHHSFEHMHNPHQVMQKLNNLLKPDKHLILGIPLASSWAWRHYGVNWVNLDAPRHFYLHSVKSLKMLMSKYGFEIIHTMYDSLGSQFMGSEQYIRDISEYSPNSYLIDPKKSIFTSEEISLYEKRAEQLNAAADGDRACFFLKKIKDI